VLQRFKRSNASEIRNGIMFDFYLGLPHMIIIIVVTKVVGRIQGMPP